MAIEKFSKYIDYKNKKYVNYTGKKILILGYGSVGQAILPIVLRHITSDAQNITVLEKGENEKKFNERNSKSSVRYVKKEIKRANLESTLSKYVDEGGFIIDVSLNIGALDIIEWCLKHGVHYINTSLERWHDEPDETIPKLAERTLYYTHKEVRAMAEKYKGAATVVAKIGRAHV